MKNKTVSWLVQTDLLEGTLSEKLPQVIKDLGHNLRTITGSFQTDDLLDEFGFLDEGSGPIICYGSQKFIRACMKYPYFPGYYPQNKQEVDNLRTQNYLTKFDSKDLLNSDYVLVPIKELIRNTNFFYNLFDTDWLFVKDNQAFKRFSAKFFQAEEIDKEYSGHKLREYLKLYQDTCKIDDHEIVFVSPFQNIVSEHRFFIVDKQVVSHSTYKYHDILDIRIDVPQKALKFAERLAQEWQPSNCYTLDVAMINYMNNYRNDDIETCEPRLIELNSFSSSGFYACNLESIVKSVSIQAIKDYIDLTSSY